MTHHTLPDWARKAQGFFEVWNGKMTVTMPPTLTLEDQGHDLALVVLNTPDEDTHWKTVSTAILGFEPDHVVLTHDGYIQEREKTDELDYTRGDLQQLHDAGDPSVLDALVCLRCDRKGTVEMISMPYRCQDHTLTWLPNVVHIQGPDCQGRMPELLAHCMTRKETIPMPPIFPIEPARFLQIQRRTCIVFLQVEGMTVVSLDPSLDPN